jgi:hypothetical protein
VLVVRWDGDAVVWASPSSMDGIRVLSACWFISNRGFEFNLSFRVMLSGSGIWLYGTHRLFTVCFAFGNPGYRNRHRGDCQPVRFAA